MKKTILRHVAFVLIAAAIGLTVSGTSRAFPIPTFPSIPDYFADVDWGALEEALKASASGKITSITASSSPNKFECKEGSVALSGEVGKSFVVAIGDKKVIFSSTSEEALKRTLSLAMAAQLSGQTVTVNGGITGCPNIIGAGELTITK